MCALRVRRAAAKMCFSRPCVRPRLEAVVREPLLEVLPRPLVRPARRRPVVHDVRLRPSAKRRAGASALVPSVAGSPAGCENARKGRGRGGRAPVHCMRKRSGVTKTHQDAREVGLLILLDELLRGRRADVNARERVDDALGAAFSGVPRGSDGFQLGAGGGGLWGGVTKARGGGAGRHLRSVGCLA